jgi:hypothetical protein
LSLHEVGLIKNIPTIGPTLLILKIFANEITEINTSSKAMQFIQAT